MRIPRASCAMALPGRSRIPSKSVGLNRRRERAETIRQDPPRSVSPGDLPAHLRAKVIAVWSPVKSRAAMDTVHWLPASRVFVPGCLVPLLAACQRFNLGHATRRTEYAGTSREPILQEYLRYDAKVLAECAWWMAPLIKTSLGLCPSL